MKYLKILGLLAVLITAAPVSNAQCDDNAYGNPGTSCAFIGADDCVYIRTFHKFLFFRWTTVELFRC